MNGANNSQSSFVDPGRIIKTVSRNATSVRNADIVDDDKYKLYKDKLYTKDKTFVISEDFVDSIKERRSKMGLEPDGKKVAYDAGSLNKKTKNLKYTYDYKGHKVPNVQSIEAKKRANILMPGTDKKAGRYSYNQVIAKDVKSIHLKKTKAIKEYRTVIDEGIKALELAQRAPIEDPSEFNEHVRKLKQRLSEIDGSAD